MLALFVLCSCCAVVIHHYCLLAHDHCTADHNNSMGFNQGHLNLLFLVVSLSLPIDYLASLSCVCVLVVKWQKLKK